mgnify:CR=1 FL=1
MKINYVIGAFLCVLGCYGCSSPKTEVKSPDGHIKMALTVDDNGKPLYNILVDDSLLIENSTLGFTEKKRYQPGRRISDKKHDFRQ